MGNVSLINGHIDEHKTDKRTIFVGVFQYKDKEYTIHYDFGIDYPDKSAEFMFLEGNYSCDCNRSFLIRNEYGNDAIPELPCGDEIVLKTYHIEHLTQERAVQ